MSTVASLKIRIGADWSEAQKAFNEVSTAIKPLADRFQQVGAIATKYISLPLAAVGAVAVKMAGDFEQAMTNAVSVTGLTGAAADAARAKMTDLAMTLGRETAFTAKQAADAMYDLASSGWDAEEMARGLPGILNLAAATQGDLAATTESVTAALGQFGLDAGESGRVADVFTAAIGASKANMDRLTPSLRQVGPIAASMGLSLEETVAALSALYNAGFQGEQAGTALRAGLASLISPAKAGTDALAAMGLTVAQVNPEAHGLATVLELLGSRGLTSAQAIDLFGREAAAGMLALISNTEGVRNLEATLASAGGTAARIANDQLDTFNGQMTILKGSIQTAAIAIGQVFLPVLQSMTGPLIDVFNWFAKLPTPILTVIGVIGAAVAAIGPLLLAIGALLKLLPLMAAGFTFLTGPVGIAILAIGAFITALAIASDESSVLGQTIGQNVLKGFREIVTGVQFASQALAMFGLISQDTANAVHKFGANLDTNIAAGDRRLAELKGTATETDDVFKSLAEQVRQASLDVATFGGGGGTGGGAVAPPASTPGFTAPPAMAMTPMGLQALGGAGDPTALRALKEGTITEMDALIAAMKEKQAQFDQVVADIGTAIRDGLTGALTGLAEGFGAMASGTASLGDVGRALLTTFAGIMQKLGGLLISFGLAGVKFQSAGGFLSFLTNPVAAIAVGGLLIAAGAAIKGFLSRSSNAGGGGAGGGSIGAISVNPNTAATTGSGGNFQGQLVPPPVQVQMQAVTVPSGNMVFSMVEGDRRLERFGTKLN